MPLDIIVNTDHGGELKSISLFIEDYDTIMKIIETENSFPIIKKALSDYYGESEIYLDEVKHLKQEVVSLIGFFNEKTPSTTMIFLNNFLKTIESAIVHRSTIKLIGD